jgi:hypothetical protein
VGEGEKGKETMSTLADLVTLLHQEVPAVDGVPSMAQYQQAIKDAALDFSRRCGLMKFGELPIVSGTTTYSLPEDFMKLVMLESLVSADGVIITNNGIIPVSADWEEEYVIINKQITFKPTPTYSMTRDFKYKSAWVFDSNDNLLNAGDEEVRIILLKAAEICFQKQADASAGGVEGYSFGAVSVKLGSSNQDSAKSKRQEYEAACKQYTGTRLAIS